MICGFLPCNNITEISKKKKGHKKYCCMSCANKESMRIKKIKKEKKKELLGLNSLHEVDIGRNVLEEVHVENVKHMDKALKGDTTSQEALKTQGLKYHYRRDEGEWGDATKSKESMLQP